MPSCTRQSLEIQRSIFINSPAGIATEAPSNGPLRHREKVPIICAVASLKKLFKTLDGCEEV